MKTNLYCKKHAKNQLIEFISFSFLEHIGVHSFLCISAHFSVHRCIFFCAYKAIISGRYPDNLCRQIEYWNRDLIILFTLR